MSGHVRGRAVEQALTQGAELRRQAWENFKEAVHRQHRAGLSPHQIAQVLRGPFSTSPEKVKKALAELGLQPNKAGGAL